jgi:hypothetical protein
MASMTDDIPSLTLKVLRGIRSDIQSLERRMDERFESFETRFESLETRFVALETRFVALERTTALGFERVSERLEHIRDFAGERYRDHEARISKLEATLAKR